MKPLYTLPLVAAIAALPFLSGCSSGYKTQPAEPAPVTSVVTVAAPQTAPASADNAQRLYGAEGLAIPQFQHAADIINNFRPVYEKLGKPRIVFYINRDLKGKAAPSIKTHPAPSGKGVVVTTDRLADKQTARDIERIAAQPFTQAGARLVDFDAAAAITAADDTKPAAADVAIETLVTSRQVVISSISGSDATVTIPDIQMTAVRLSDATIIGQATANDIINQLSPAALGSLGVQDALEATALNLMVDITAREQ